MTIRRLCRIPTGSPENEVVKLSAPGMDPPQEPGRRKTIILVDDLPEVLASLEALIRQSIPNVRILKFTDGEQAWQEVLREEPDLLSSDLVRPGVNGCELLRRLAQRRVKFPILIVSTAGTSWQEEARRCAGPELNFTFVSKPFDTAVLLSLVRAGLRCPLEPAPRTSPNSRP